MGKQCMYSKELIVNFISQCIWYENMDYKLIKNIKLSDWNCQPVKQKLYYILRKHTIVTMQIYHWLIKKLVTCASIIRERNSALLEEIEKWWNKCNLFYYVSLTKQLKWLTQDMFAPGICLPSILYIKQMLNIIGYRLYQGKQFFSKLQ